MLIFLIIGFKIPGHVEKRNSFQRTPFLKASFFDTFKHATCYNSLLVLFRLDPTLVKAAYNIACPQLQLNGDTLISLYAVLLMLERVWTRLQRFSADAKATHAQDISSVKATNELKSKVLKNNTMNGKNLKCYYDQIFDNHFFR